MGLAGGEYMRWKRLAGVAGLIGIGWAMAPDAYSPSRRLSRLFGDVARTPTPPPVQNSLMAIWTYLFSCNLDEMEAANFDAFAHFDAFFTRRLKPDARQFDRPGICAPSDGRILSHGWVDAGQDSLLQVKGREVKVSELVGNTPYPSSLYYFIIYLAPGDYHGFHAPIDFTLEHATHIPGYLYSVSPFMCKLKGNLFGENERIVFRGKDRAGNYIAYIPVGAYNVGSIQSLHHPTLRTNYNPQDRALHVPIPLPTPERCLRKGDPIGYFHLGSSIILLLESDEGIEDRIQVGQNQHVRAGEVLVAP